MAFGFSGHCIVELCCIEVQKAKRKGERKKELLGCKDVTWNTLTKLECIREMPIYALFFMVIACFHG